MKKRVLIVLFLTIVLLGATGLTEYLFYRQDEKSWVQNFEKRLHKQEAWADNVLDTFRDSVRVDEDDYGKDVLFLGFYRGKIFFWTDEVVGGKELYARLSENGNFVKLGNTYYEVRHRKHKDRDYFALLRIKDDYPYTNNYIKNSFGRFLNISEENVSLVNIQFQATEDAHLVTDRDGNGLFFLTYDKSYKGQGTNYLLVILYLISFLSLFYVYHLLLKNTSSWKKQLLILVGFISFLGGLRWFMQYYEIPACIYRLSVFDNLISEGLFVSSIGDLLLTAFCVFHVVYITFSNLKINYKDERLRHYRYLIACLLFLVVFLYVDFYNFAIDLVVAKMDIHLNIAQLMHVGGASLITFIAICLGGLVILLGIIGTVSVLYHLVTFKDTVKIATLACLFLWGLSNVLGLYTNFWDCLFIWGITMLFAINIYILKPDVRRSVYLLAIFLLSVYVVMITKKYERYKEQRQRLEYATELIEERDYNFEGELAKLDYSISSSDVLAFLVGIGENVQAEGFLREKLLDITGYDYYSDIAFCHEGDSLWLKGLKEEWKCREYFDRIIWASGYRLGQTHFYAIRTFDGFVTYIGKFRFGDTCLFLRFDAAKETKSIGYPQILSRKSGIAKEPLYNYSYAKYLNGKLVASTGEFVYGKKLKPWSKNMGSGVRIVNKDHYSHMLIAVNAYDTLIISLPERTFALYYMNVLYAFLVCSLLASYGSSFNVNENINFRKVPEVSYKKQCHRIDIHVAGVAYRSEYIH